MEENKKTRLEEFNKQNETVTENKKENKIKKGITGKQITKIILYSLGLIILFEAFGKDTKKTEKPKQQTTEQSTQNNENVKTKAPEKKEDEIYKGLTTEQKNALKKG